VIIIKKEAKMALIVFVLLVVAVVPIYLYIRQNAGTEGVIQVTGAVNNPANVTVSELKTFPSVTLQVTLTSSSSPQENGIFNYTGATVRDILEQADALESATSVYVQASDGYGTTLSFQEIMQNEKTILAYEKDGEPLKPFTEGGEGPVRLVIATDEYAQRWIKSVTVIEVS
jgi:DMSO/TMAO reductase YedYZ molybdopterin-dependent catalytic subunit